MICFWYHMILWAPRGSRGPLRKVGEALKISGLATGSEYHFIIFYHSLSHLTLFHSSLSLLGGAFGLPYRTAWEEPPAQKEEKGYLGAEIQFQLLFMVPWALKAVIPKHRSRSKSWVLPGMSQKSPKKKNEKELWNVFITMVICTLTIPLLRQVDDCDWQGRQLGIWGKRRLCFSS